MGATSSSNPSYKSVYFDIRIAKRAPIRSIMYIVEFKSEMGAPCAAAAIDCCCSYPSPSLFLTTTPALFLSFLFFSFSAPRIRGKPKAYVLLRPTQPRLQNTRCELQRSIDQKVQSMRLGKWPCAGIWSVLSWKKKKKRWWMGYEGRDGRDGAQEEKDSD